MRKRPLTRAARRKDAFISTSRKRCQPPRGEASARVRRARFMILLLLDARRQRHFMRDEAYALLMMLMMYALISR